MKYTLSVNIKNYKGTAKINRALLLVLLRLKGNWNFSACILQSNKDTDGKIVAG